MAALLLLPLIGPLLVVGGLVVFAVLVAIGVGLLPLLILGALMLIPILALIGVGLALVKIAVPLVLLGLGLWFLTQGGRRG